MAKDPDSIQISELGWKFQKQFFSTLFGSLCMESRSRSFTISNKAVNEFMDECAKSGPAHFHVDGDDTTDLTMSVTWEK
jgi:hypothetical protein